MAQLQVQTLLRDDASALDQIRSLGIKIRAHGTYPNLVQFTYNQIAAAPFKDHPIVKECRGLILDRDDNWNIVAWPFTRFFNWGEPGAADIDWTSARIQEKLDGSLIIVYWYAGAWHAATKGTPDGVATTWDGSTTYASYFWQAVDRSDRDIRAALIPGWTYCFEITGEATRVVTQQLGNAGTATVLAIRDQAGREQDVTVWADQLPVVRHFDFHTAEAVSAAAQALDPLNQEGFVVVDGAFRRVKIKSPRYVEIHYAKFTLSPRGLIDLVRSGESAEVLAYFPELQSRYDDLNRRLQTCATEAQDHYARVAPADGVRDRDSRRQFAALVTSTVPAPFQGAMFAFYDGRVTTGRQWLIQQSTNSILNLLGVADVSMDAES